MNGDPSLKEALSSQKLTKKESFTLHVVIPMAGDAPHFQKAGFQEPKPFIPIGGKKMITWVIENMIPKEMPKGCHELKFHLIIRKSHLKEHSIENIFQDVYPNVSYTFHIIDGLTEGAACTVLLTEKEIDNEDPLIIVNSDQYLEWNPDEFYNCLLNSQHDGVVLTFYQPNKSDERWSFVKINDNYFVSEVQEKKWISPYAAVGLYGWKKGSDFVECAKQMIAKDIRVRNEFYLCPVYNELILNGGSIYMLLCDQMWSLGLPDDLEKFSREFLKN
jgi:dTDP-glucose pyrophosphorylase